MFKTIVFAAVLALAAAAPAPAPAPGVVSSYTGVVGAPTVYSVPSVSAYSVPSVSTYGASPVVTSYGVQPVGYSSYYGYGGVPVTYY